MNRHAASAQSLNARRHFPKVRGGQAAPDWMIEHSDRNMQALGPTPAVLAEWRSAGLALPDLGAMRRYRLARIREQLRDLHQLQLRHL